MIKNEREQIKQETEDSYRSISAQIAGKPLF